MNSVSYVKGLGKQVLREVDKETDIDFDDLLSRIRSGDREAEDTLVRRFWRGLYFILYRQTGDQELCGDLTQDALLLVVAKARNGEIKHPRALSSYVRKVGENKLIGYRRKQARQKTDVASDVIDRIADGSRSLVASVRSDQISEYIATVLSELSHDRDRDILNRHYLIGENKAEICEALQLSKPQADVVLHRARQRLKALITKKEGSGNGPRAADLLGLVILVLAGAKDFASSLHLNVMDMLHVCAGLSSTRRWREA